jgi:tetratricopeptide (TPR) repeat protein
MKQKADNIIERHDAPDIFCDGALAIGFRHDVCRIRLHSDRVDPVDGETVNRIVVGHLSIPAAAFVDLYNQMTAAIQRVTKAGEGAGGRKGSAANVMIGGDFSTICERGSRLQDHNPLEQIRRRIEAGDPSWAIERLRSLISKGVAAPDVHRLLALAHLKHGAFDAAVAALKDARAVNTTSTTELAFGRFLNKEGHKKAALNCFLSAVELNPENADALALVCRLYAELGQPDKAIQYGQRSLEARDASNGGLQPYRHGLAAARSQARRSGVSATCHGARQPLSGLAKHGTYP